MAIFILVNIISPIALFIIPQPSNKLTKPIKQKRS